MYWEVKWWYCEYGSCFEGTYKVRNAIETKRNQRKRSETKSTKTKRNENEIKRNQRKQNEIDWYEENGRKKIRQKKKITKKKDNSMF